MNRQPICYLNRAEAMIGIGGWVLDKLDCGIVSNATMSFSTPSSLGGNLANGDVEGLLNEYSGLDNPPWTWSILPSILSRPTSIMSCWFLVKAETNLLRRFFQYNIDPCVATPSRTQKNYSNVSVCRHLNYWASHSPTIGNTRSSYLAATGLLPYSPPQRQSVLKRTLSFPLLVRSSCHDAMPRFWRIVFGLDRALAKRSAKKFEQSSRVETTS